MVVLAMLAGFAANAAPAAAGWGQPFHVSSLGDYFQPSRPDVAAAPDGSYLAAWQRVLPASGNSEVIEAAWVDASGTPGPPLRLTPTAGNVTNPQLAVGAGGNAIAIWNRVVAPQQIAVESRRIARDGRLGPVVTVSEPKDRSLRTAVAIDSAGTATVGWIHQIIDSAVLKVRTLPASGPPGPVHNLTDLSSGATSEVAIAVGADRRPLVVYKHFATIEAQKLSATGQPLPGILVLSHEDDSPFDPEVGMDANGVARVSWDSLAPAPFPAFSRTVAPSGALGDTVLVSPAGRNAVGPDLAVNAGGAAALVWQDTPQTGPPPTVQGGTILPDGTLGAQLPLSDPSSTGGMDPRIAIDADGVATSVWARGTGGALVAEAARFSSGGAQGRVAELSDPASGVDPLPDVASSPGGRVLAIWVQDTPDHHSVRIDGALFTGGPAHAPPPVPPMPPSPPPDPPATCDGRKATIVGTSQDDDIVGTPRRDVIAGGAGDDLIRGHGGKDLICGQRGDDELRGNQNRDVVFGGSGDDQALGGKAGDMLAGQRGEDDLKGARSDDELLGGPQDDTLDGGVGTNRCRGGGGVNVLVRCQR